MCTHNKEVVRCFVEEVINCGDTRRIADLVTDNHIRHGLDGDFYGPEGVRIDLAEYWAGFPDLRVVVEDLIAEGDRVVSRFVLHGTHVNPFLGLAPTGHAVTVPGVAIDRIAGGRLAESWVNLDLFGLLRSPLGTRVLSFVS